MKPLLVVLLLISLINLGYSQDQNIIDSLNRVIEEAEEICEEPCENDTVIVRCLFYLATQYYLSEPKKAKDICQRALELSKEIDYKFGIADGYGWLGYLVEINGESKKALDYNLNSYMIYKELGEEKRMTTALSNIGANYNTLGNTEKAVEYYNKSLDLREKLNDQNGISSSLVLIGKVYYHRGDFNKAIECYNKSLRVRDSIGDIEGMASSYNSFGELYYSLGNIPKAEECFSLSLKLFTEIGDKSGIALGNNNIAIVYNDKGEVDKAIDHYKRSLELYTELGYATKMAVTINNLGTIYAQQGDHQKALDYYNMSYDLYKKYEYVEGMASAYNSMGTAHDDLGNMELALKNYNKCIELYEKIDDKGKIAMTYNNIGSLYRKKSCSDKLRKNFIVNDSLFQLGLDYFNKSLEIQEKHGDKHDLFLSYINLGRANQQSKNNKLFELYALKSYDLAIQMNLPRKLQSSFEILKDLYFYNNESHKADSFAMAAIELSNQLIISNFITLPETGQKKYFDQVRKNYMDFNSYTLFRGNDNPELLIQVYNNTLKNKGILLRSSTAMRNVILNSNDSVLIEKYYSWLLLKNELSKLYSLGESTDSLEKVADKHEEELVRKSDVFSDYSKFKNISWQEVRNNLKDDQAAIEFVHFSFRNYKRNDYWVVEDSVLYCALILKADSDYPVLIPLFEEKQLEKIIGTFGENDITYISDIYGANNKSETQLYKLIWKPMEENLKGIKKVYISPSGLLHKIAFSAIAKEQNVYLCDLFDVSMFTSTGNIAFYADRPMDVYTMDASVFGGINYNTDSTKNEQWKFLAGSKTEMEMISNILSIRKNKVIRFDMDNATEEAFKRIAAESDLLHIATHGFFFPDPDKVKDEMATNTEHGEITFRGGSRGLAVNTFVENKNPLMRSGLVLAGANDVWNEAAADSVEDGVLTAQEIAHTDMRKAKLVVMSACETGLGDIKGSEGVYGLQRAFKMAGADYLIMSLWQVPDKETAEFMTIFYKNLMKQSDINAAFLITQKEMRKKYDPYFWAAFVLIN